MDKKNTFVPITSTPVDYFQNSFAPYNNPMHIENKKLKVVKQPGYPVYYQKITTNYKLGKGILLFLYSRKREFFHFFQNNHQNYEPDDNMQPIYSIQKRKTGEDSFDLKKTFFFHHNLPATGLY